MGWEVTLEDLVNNYLDPRKAKGEGEVWVKCPFCNDEKYRMGINVISGLAHCFRASCEWKTTDRRHLFRELSKLFNVDERMDDIRLRRKVKKAEPFRITGTLPEGFEKFDDDDAISAKAVKYLTSRGVTEKQIDKYKLGFCATGKYAWRIIIPIYRKGKMVAFTGRDFSGDPEVDPKYMNSTGTKFLYNVPRNGFKSVALLLEGPFDVWAGERACERKDFRCVDVLGRLGSGMTKHSLNILLRYDETIIWPDPDKGGVDLCIATAISLDKRNRKVTVVMPKDGDVDPGKLGETEEGLSIIRKKLERRVPWNDSVRMKLRYFGAFA